MVARHVSACDLRQVESGGADWAACLIACADDAIIGIDPHGAIVSWNPAAARLLGYTETEALGAPVAMLGHDGGAMLRRLQGGEPIEPCRADFRRKDGGTVEVSVAVSAVRHGGGETVGVAIIARKVFGRMRAQEDSALLIAELHHRIRNLFALAGGVVALSARFAATPEDLAKRVRSRLVALSRISDLVLPDGDDAGHPEIELAALIDSIVGSYGKALSDDERRRVIVTGPEIAVTSGSATPLALLLNELAINALKYGALSQHDGTITVTWTAGPSDLCILWREAGGPLLNGTDPEEGFGGQFIRIIVSRQLGGTITRNWTPEGLIVRLTVPLSHVQR